MKIGDLSLKLFLESVIWLVASPGLLVGLLSLFNPEGSIKFYQWIMRQFNWEVKPIDGAKEIRNTRLLGFVLVVSVAGFLYALSRIPILRTLY